jgi:arylsulfatase A-like enzyme/Tfp pilus assembly protein PilF
MGDHRWQSFRRRRLGLLACALAALTIGFTGWRAFALSRRPHVLLITLDTTRADRLGCYGYGPAFTPALDSLAAQGVLFEKACTPAPLTLPSHASMMTGLYPPEHGLITNGRGRLASSVPVLAETFHDAGYDTAAFVGSFVLSSKFGLQRGFTTYDDDMTNTEPTEYGLHRQRDGRRVVDAALAWLQLRERPFFCWVHLYDAHHPYLSHADEFGEQFEERPYDGEIAYVDRQVGRLVDFLHANRLWERTLVVVVGDHGESLGEHNEEEHSLTLYNSVLRVPFLWAGRGATAAGRRVTEPVSLIDLRPTLLETAGLRDPARTSGRSLCAALVGGQVAARDCYAATDDPLLEHGWSPLRSLTTAAWKYIRSTEVELYDLASDPQELRNLASDRPMPVKEMEEKLAALERSMAMRQGESVELSPQERRALTSLGYLGGQNSRNAVAASGDQLPDVKRMLPVQNAVDRARKKFSSGQLAEAERESRSILTDTPNYVEAELLLAESLAAQEEFAAAREVLDRILARDARQSKAHFQIGLMEIAQNRRESAVQHFLQELDAKPDQVGVLYNLGLTFAQLGQPQEARRYYEEALELDPMYVNAHIALGLALTQERPQEAAEHYRRALAYNPGAVEAHANLAILLAGQQQMKEAEEHFAAAARLDPRNPETRFNYGTFLMVSGRPGEAINELSEALRLKPDHAQARERLQQAQGLRSE